MQQNAPEVSVVLPILNESAWIAAAVASLQAGGADYEAIIVDGGSDDGTLAILEGLTSDRVRIETIPGPSTRAAAMNRGAAEARADLLLFLHGDCRLAPGSLADARDAVGRGAIGGGFLKRYEPSSPLLALNLLWLNGIRARLFRCLVGTNAIFCERRFFKSIAGYPDLPFLEDVLLSDALRRAGRIAVLRDTVIVSARKYSESGAFARTLRNAEIMFRFRFLGQDPASLLARYRVG